MNRGFWREPVPLLLASGSVARRMLIAAAGIPLDILKVDLDERALADRLAGAGESPAGIARALAGAKAEAAARIAPDRLLLAADQTLDHQDRLVMKATDRNDARERLRALSGTVHRLHSAATLRRGGRVIWQGSATAELTMRPLTGEFLDLYLETAGDSVLASVGGYQLEGLGIHLFSRIEGDHATILGLPLLDLLGALRGEGCLAG